MMLVVSNELRRTVLKLALLLIRPTMKVKCVRRPQMHVMNEDSELRIKNHHHRMLGEHSVLVLLFAFFKKLFCFHSLTEIRDMQRQ